MALSIKASKRSVFLVDDHPMVRERLAQLIAQEPDLQVCGEAEDVASALAGIGRSSPDIVIVDLSLKNSRGMELIRILHERSPNLPILVLSMHDENAYAERVLRAGARGYITKQEATKNILVALRQTLEGKTYVSESMREHLLQKWVLGRPRPASPAECLTDRELEIFQLIGHGRQTREIAEQLKLGIKTVESYRARIKEKLGIENATQLIQQATQWVHDLSGR